MPTCQHNLDILTHLCDDLGVPFALEKVKGPSTAISFLHGDTFGYYKHGNQTPCRSAGVNQRHLTHLAGKEESQYTFLSWLTPARMQVKIYN